MLQAKVLPMNVLFVCVHNASRSQMAEALFNHRAPEGMHAASAGTEPAAEISPTTVQAMAEIDVDLAGQAPKVLSPDMVREADRIITMGCGVDQACPLFLGVRIDEDWGLDDPAGQPIEVVRGIRDQIDRRVVELIGRLAQPND